MFTGSVCVYCGLDMFTGSVCVYCGLDMFTGSMCVLRIRLVHWVSVCTVD